MVFIVMPYRNRRLAQVQYGIRSLKCCSTGNLSDRPGFKRVKAVFFDLRNIPQPVICNDGNRKDGPKINAVKNFAVNLARNLSLIQSIPF